jgi:hypothetical protein
MIGRRIASERDYHRFQIGGSAAGDVKSLLVHDTGLEPQEQHLPFKGQEKQDYELLRDASVQDKSKLLLVEDAAARERRLRNSKSRSNLRVPVKLSHMFMQMSTSRKNRSVCSYTYASFVHDLFLIKHPLPGFFA